MNPLKHFDISDYDPSEWSMLDEADLRGANLRDAQITYCSFREAKLRGADLRGADLRASRFLYTAQLKEAIGDQNTRIHKHLERPEAWSLTYEEQLERLEVNNDEVS